MPGKADETEKTANSTSSETLLRRLETVPSKISAELVKNPPQYHSQPNHDQSSTQATLQIPVTTITPKKSLSEKHKADFAIGNAKKSPRLDGSKSAGTCTPDEDFIMEEEVIIDEFNNDISFGNSSYDGINPSQLNQQQGPAQVALTSSQFLPTSSQSENLSKTISPAENNGLVNFENNEKDQTKSTDLSAEKSKLGKINGGALSDDSSEGENDSDDENGSEKEQVSLEKPSNEMDVDDDDEKGTSESSSENEQDITFQQELWRNRFS